MRGGSRLMLISDRLRFESWLPEDLPRLFELHADPRMQTSYSSHPDKWPREGIARRLAGYMKDQDDFGFTKWKLSLADGTFVGRAGWSRWKEAKIEIGYAIKPEYWNQGYASEAARALLAWALARRPQERLVGFALPHNATSRHILSRIGMRFVDYRLINNAVHAYYERGAHTEA